LRSRRLTADFHPLKVNSPVIEHPNSESRIDLVETTKIRDLVPYFIQGFHVTDKKLGGIVPRFTDFAPCSDQCSPGYWPKLSEFGPPVNGRLAVLQIETSYNRS
jgi:hypothetical protein